MTKKNTPLFRIILGVMVGVALTQSAMGLTLDEFIGQVKEKNMGLQVALKTIDALSHKINEREAPTIPQFLVSYSFLSDKKISTFSSFLGTESTLQTAGAVVKTQLASGLSLSGGYELDSSTYPQSSLGGMTKAYSTATTYVEIMYPLWKNGSGQTTRATRSGIEESYLAAIKLNEFAIDTVLAHAEALYWRASLAREGVTLAEEAVTRAKKMVAWTQSREQLALGDPSDLLQVQALQELRQLELRSAKEEVMAAERAFNALRGNDPNSAVAPLKNMGDPQLIQLKWPIKGPRKDVHAAYHTLMAARAKTIVDLDTLEPALNLIGQLKLNQTDSTALGVINRTLATNYPTAYVGVQFSGALDMSASTLDTIKLGNKELLQAAELNYKQKTTDADNEWNDLTHRFDDTQHRLKVVQRFEAIQRQKWQLESDRHQKGRSTMLQVLNTEQDYANARLTHLRTKAEILTLFTHRKLFGS